jgi:hypothetical protein
MKRTIFASAALMFLAVGGSAMAQKHGGDQGDKHDRSGQGKPSEGKKQERAPRVQAAVQQQQHVAKQEQRAIRSNQNVDQRTRIVQRQTAQLQRQRAAQYQVEQRNAARLLQQRQRLQQEQLRLQQQRLQAARNPRVVYVNTAPRYRYIVRGVPRQTSQYGADALRQAVNYGYREGFRTGRSDRVNGYAANYANSAEYRNATYGYSGNYVDRSDYNYYFREGFQRGYDDGYYGRSQYGNYTNGSASILGTVLTSLLGLQAIR